MSIFSKIFGKRKKATMPEEQNSKPIPNIAVQIEHITQKKRYHERREQVQILVDAGETDQIIRIMRKLVEQGYIAGLNSLSLDNIKTHIVGNVGDEALLVRNFLKDKGLC